MVLQGHDHEMKAKAKFKDRRASGLQPTKGQNTERQRPRTRLAAAGNRARLSDRSKGYSACTGTFGCELDEICLKTPSGTELCAPQECEKVRAGHSL